MGSQICSRCRQEKSLEEFGPNAGRPRGRNSRCRPCEAAYQREWRKANPEKVRLRSRQWEKANPGHDSRIRYRCFIRRKYGLTPEAYDAMVIAQSGRCWICNSNADDLAVDHSHVTGAVRELLCRPCNVSLGNAQESPERLRSMAEYLEKHHQNAP